VRKVLSPAMEKAIWFGTRKPANRLAKVLVVSCRVSLGTSIHAQTSAYPPVVFVNWRGIGVLRQRSSVILCRQLVAHAPGVTDIIAQVCRAGSSIGL